MKVCGVYHEKGGEILSHPVHREWIDSVSDMIGTVRTPDMSGPLGNTCLPDLLGEVDVPDADVYILESVPCLFQQDKIDGKTIFLATSWRWHGHGSYDYSRHPFPKRIPRRLDREVDIRKVRKGLSEVDTIITVSEMMKSSMEDYTDSRIHICRPGYGDVERLPYTSDDGVVFMGVNREHKGVGLLRKALGGTDIEVRIAGTGHPDSEHDNIEVCGYIEDKKEFLATGGLFVHPARFDAHPVTPMEAAQFGTPVLVTEMTGTKEVLGCGVVEPDPDSIREKVRSFFRGELGYSCKCRPPMELSGIGTDRFKEVVHDAI